MLFWKVAMKKETVLKHFSLYFGPLIGKDLQKQYVCTTTWRKSSEREHVCSRPMRYSWSRENGSQPEAFLLSVLDFGSSLVYISGVQRSELLTNGPCLLQLPGNAGNGPEFKASAFFQIQVTLKKRKMPLSNLSQVFQSVEFPCDTTSQLLKKSNKSFSGYKYIGHELINLSKGEKLFWKWS